MTSPLPGRSSTTKGKRRAKGSQPRRHRWHHAYSVDAQSSIGFRKACMEEGRVGVERWPPKSCALA
eukprot:3079832-Pleurochrysis_carterae.AAC.1